mgnify:CR=1 FL=1
MLARARDDAKVFFGGRGEPLKVQLIDEKTEGQREVSCYTIKDKETFIDFCVGPHVPSTSKLKAFKKEVAKVSKNKSLTLEKAADELKAKAVPVVAAHKELSASVNCKA